MWSSLIRAVSVSATMVATQKGKSFEQICLIRSVSVIHSCFTLNEKLHPQCITSLQRSGCTCVDASPRDDGNSLSWLHDGGTSSPFTTDSGNATENSSVEMQPWPDVCVGNILFAAQHECATKNGRGWRGISAAAGGRNYLPLPLSELALSASLSIRCNRRRYESPSTSSRP